MRPSHFALAALAVSALGTGLLAASRPAQAFEERQIEVSKGSPLAAQLSDQDDDLRLNKHFPKFEGGSGGSATLYKSEDGRFTLGLSGSTDSSGRSDPWSVGGPGMPVPMFFRR